VHPLDAVASDLAEGLLLDEVPRVAAKKCASAAKPPSRRAQSCAARAETSSRPTASPALTLIPER
jgi:hypothetical protein